MTYFRILEKYFTQSRVTQRFLGGAFWSISGTVFSQGVILVGGLIVARSSGKEIYGQFILLQTTLSMLVVFCNFGTSNTVSRYIAALKLNNIERLSNIFSLSIWTVLALGLLASLLLATNASYFANHIFKSPSISNPLFLASGFLFFSALDGVYKSALVGFGAMRSYALSAIIGSIFSTLLIILAAYSNRFDNLAFALFFGSFIQATVSYFFLKPLLILHGIKINLKSSMQEWKVLRDFAFPAMLASAMITPAHWVTQVILSRESSGYSEIAVLGIAMQWFNFMLLFPSILNRVITTMLTEYIENEKHKDGIQLLKFSILINILVCTPLALFVIILSPYILSMYGAEFKGGASTIAAAATTALLIGIQSPIGALITARSRMWLGLSMNICWAVIYIFGSFLMRDYGAFGVILSLLFAYIIHSIWTLSFAWLQIRP